jgi:hypothetical protein
MPLYKVWNSTRDVKKAAIACSFAEFVSKVMCLYDIYFILIKRNWTYNSEHKKETTFQNYIHCKTKSFEPIIKLNKHLNSSWFSSCKVIWETYEADMGIWLCFCPHRWEFDNGFGPHRRKFDRIFFEKSNSRRFARGGDYRSWNWLVH